MLRQDTSFISSLDVTEFDLNRRREEEEHHQEVFLSEGKE